jgi:hypothetical protein
VEVPDGPSQFWAPRGIRLGPYKTGNPGLNYDTPVVVEPNDTPSKGGRTLTYGPGPPSTGSWKQGDIIFNSSVAAAGGISYWQCTTAGEGTNAIWVPHSL